MPFAVPSYQAIVTYVLSECSHLRFSLTRAQLAIGTKSGEILVYDIAASALIDTIQAHTATVWSMQVRPDSQALVTGSADKDVKFWEFEQKSTDAQSGKGISLVHSRTLKMTDDVLSVRYSPNGKLLAVSLLDATVKVFYQDTLKFFISLYGHKVGPAIRNSSYDAVGITYVLVIASGPRHGHIWRLKAHRDLLGGQER